MVWAFPGKGVKVMTELISQLQLYLGYPFVRYALIVGVLIALCSSLLGVTLVLKRFSNISSSKGKTAHS